MNINVNKDILNKTIEAAANTTKIVANLTDKNSPVQKPKTEYRGGNSTNQPHNQTVEVKVGSQDQPKPTIIERKPETHIHKNFPDNRALTPEECKLEELRIRLEYEEKDKQRAHAQHVLDQEYARRLERENAERREREERERKHAKERRIRRLIFGGLAAAGAGLAYYDWRTGNGLFKTRGNSVKPLLPEGNVSKPISGEGKVE